MRIKSAVFEGIPESAVGAQPWIGSPPLCKSGVPIGISMETREPVLFDPWALKEDGDIHSTIFAIIGQKNSGKSTLMKFLLALLMSMQAGAPGGNPVEMRARIHDRKRENGQPEYGPMTEFLQSEVISLNQSGLINIFDPNMGMTQLDLIDTAVNVCETVGGRSLINHETLALQVGIWKMQNKLRQIATPEMLEAILRGLKIRDVDEYYQQVDDHLKALFEDELADNPELRENLRLCLERPSNITASELEHDAGIVSGHFGKLLRGEYGRVIGGKRSLREALALPVGTFDWTGVPDKARTLIEALFFKWQDVAMGVNDLEILPHLEFGDEEHEAFDNLMHVRFYSSYIAKARQLHTARFIGTQFETDFLMAGEKDSEIRRLSEKIIRGFAGRFIGRMENDDETAHRLSQLGISEYDIQMLTILPQGCFGIKLQDRPIVFVQIIPPPTVLRLAYTNAAAKRMTERVPWMSLGYVRERAHEAGLI